MNRLEIIKIARQFVLVCFCCVITTLTVFGQESVQVRNSARYIGSGRYDWTVCLSRDTPASVLDAIEFVEYTLHPTFPNPVQRGEDRYFSYSAYGWGEFNKIVKVRFKDGREATINYELNLDEESDTCPKAIKKRTGRKRK